MSANLGNSHWSQDWKMSVFIPVPKNGSAKDCSNYHTIALISHPKKMMLWKCCTQYASKFGKLSSGHRTRKGPFSFQSQRKAMPKNVQTAVQLCSFHMQARLYSKSFKLAFNIMWTEHFQMYKLGFKEAEESETKLPTFIGSGRNQGSSRKTSINTSASLTTLKPLCESQQTVQHS